MIVIDTHIWIWWVTDDHRLSANHRRALADNRPLGIGVSIISCWEIAKLVQGGRIVLTLPVLDWLNQALAQPGVRLLDLTPAIAVASTQLPGDFHRDPADQIIVATARELNIEPVTIDERILHYPHVRTIVP